MPDNQPAATPRDFRLPGHAVLALAGRDAAKFAQAQFMGDVDALAPGHWHWNGWLTPKGRVLALFAQGASWGGYESLIRQQSPREPGPAERLLRLHVGLEAVEDLLADLAQAFEALTP